MYSSLPLSMRKIPIPAVEPKTEVNDILAAFRDHLLWHKQHGPEQDMALSPLDQWVAWLQNGDQGVTDDEDMIRHAEQVIFRLGKLTVAARAECMHNDFVLVPMEPGEDDTYMCEACGEVWCEANGEDPNRG